MMAGKMVSPAGSSGPESAPLLIVRDANEGPSNGQLNSHGTFRNDHYSSNCTNVMAGNSEPTKKSDGVLVDTNLEDAIRTEHDLTFFQACRLYPAAIGWSAFVSIGVIMLAFDPQLLGNLYAMPQFRKDFGYMYDGDVGIV